MSGRALLLAAWLLAGAVPLAAADGGKVIFNFDDPSDYDPFLITPGEADPSAPSDPKGMCIGAGCGTSPAHTPQPAAAPPLPAVQTSAPTLTYASIGDLKALLDGSDGTPQWGGLSGPGMDITPSTDNPLGVGGAIERLFDAKIFLPDALTAKYLDDLKALSVAADAGHTIDQVPSASYPEIPGGDDLWDIVVNRIFEPQMSDPRLQNRDYLHHWFYDKAESRLISQYGTTFAAFEQSAAEIEIAAATVIAARLATAADRTNETVILTRGFSAAQTAEFDTVRRLNAPSIAALSYDALLAQRLSAGLRKHCDILAGNADLALPVGSCAGSADIKIPAPANQKFADAYAAWRATKPSTYQGILAKALARFLLDTGNAQAKATSAQVQEDGERLRESALAVLDVASAHLPLVGTARDLYEAFEGEDVMTGLALSPSDRLIRAASAAADILSRLPFDKAMGQVVAWIDGFDKAAPPDIKTAGESLARTMAPFGHAWPEEVAKLRDAADAWRNYRIEMKNQAFPFSMGSGTKAEADALGLAWVGEGAREAKYGDKTFYLSKDMLTEYQPSNYKPDLKKYQSNFKKRLTDSGPWLSNGHFDISDP